MKNILIINLDCRSDIYLSGHLINSITYHHPGAKIDILTFKEFGEMARMLKYVHQVHCIDREKISTILKNNVFPNIYALEELYNNTARVKLQKWDWVINYSHHELAQTLTSYLCPHDHNHFSGVKLSANHLPLYSGKWSSLFHQLPQEHGGSAIHLTDWHHHILNMIPARGGIKVRTNPRYNQIAFKNMSMIRKNKSSSEKVPRIIGIQLVDLLKSEKIPLKIVEGVIRSFLKDDRFFPLIMVEQEKHHQKLASKLNHKFNNQLIIVESDFMALPSVLINIDLLIASSSSVVKHIADLAQTPLMEISLQDSSSLLPRAASGLGNIALTRTVPQVVSQAASQPAPRVTPTSSDIVSAVECLFNNCFDGKISSGHTLYQVKRDHWGIFYAPILGEYDPQQEIFAQLKRYYLYFLTEKYDQFPSFPKGHYNLRQLKNCLMEEKIILTDVNKDLLGAIRIILNHQNRRFYSESNSKKLANSLEKLFSHLDSPSLVNIPILIFKEKLKSLQIEEDHLLRDRAGIVEKLIYQLKSNLQLLSQFLNSIEKFAPKSDFSKEHKEHKEHSFENTL